MFDSLCYSLAQFVIRSNIFAQVFFIQTFFAPETGTNFLKYFFANLAYLRLLFQPKLTVIQ